MAKTKSYEDQIEELEQIIADIESDDISIDLLAEKVKRAATLIRNCQSVLDNTKADVGKILDELDQK